MIMIEAVSTARWNVVATDGRSRRVPVEDPCAHGSIDPSAQERLGILGHLWGEGPRRSREIRGHLDMIMSKHPHVASSIFVAEMLAAACALLFYTLAFG
jgi:hypothetical protein